MIEELEVAIVYGGTKALRLLEDNPLLNVEDAIKDVMTSLDAPEEIKISAISAVNDILKMKRQFPNLGDKELIQKYINELNDN